MAREHRLDSLLNPASVAIVGASERNHYSNLAMTALEGIGYSGRGPPGQPPGSARVRPARRAVDCRSIGEPVDTAYLCVPYEALLDAAADAIDAGIGNLVVLAGGFAEVGGEGAVRQAQLAQLCDAAGVRVLGPNCLGFRNLLDRVALGSHPVRAPGGDGVDRRGRGERFGGHRRRPLRRPAGRRLHPPDRDRQRDERVHRRPRRLPRRRARGEGDRAVPGGGRGRGGVHGRRRAGARRPQADRGDQGGFGAGDGRHRGGAHQRRRRRRPGLRRGVRRGWASSGWRRSRSSSPPPPSWPRPGPIRPTGCRGRLDVGRDVRDRLRPGRHRRAWTSRSSRRRPGRSCRRSSPTSASCTTRWT